MKFNKILIVTVLLIVFFTLSTVSAQNINETQPIEEIDGGSFDDLSFKIQNTTEHSTLTLENDYKYHSGPTDGILINKSITIDGQGHSIDGSGMSRIFNVSYGTYDNSTSMHVVFKNMTFVNASFDGQGAAIFAYQENPNYNKQYDDLIELIDCSFISNHAEDGGAVYCNVYSKFTDCSFTNNSAESFAGAIALIGKTTINNCNFNNNDAYNAGAVYWTRGDISDSRFENNSAKSNGGAMSYSAMTFMDRAIYNSIINCEFTNNYAFEGGATYAYNARGAHDLSVNGCLFEDNNAGWRGGAFAWSGDLIEVGRLYLDSCRFKNNSADTAGAVYATNFAFIDKCGFEDNHAQIAGAIYQDLIQSYGEMTSNSNFTKNTALEGGATYVSLAEYPYVNCTFIENRADSGSIIFGGNLVNCRFVNNIPQPFILTSANVNTVYNGGKYLVVSLKNADNIPIKGANISITLNGNEKVYQTNAEGQVKVTTNSLVPKTYFADIICIDNNMSCTSKVTVKKATPKMTAKAKTFKKSVKTKKYSITLKDNKNKVMKNIKVTLKVNKKTYTAKTTSKGVATFKITKLTKNGKYKATVTYKGNNCYNKVTVKPTITVK